MEDLDNGMEDDLPSNLSYYFDSIKQLFTAANKLCETKLHESFDIISLLELKQHN